MLTLEPQSPGASCQEDCTMPTFTDEAMATPREVCSCTQGHAAREKPGFTPRRRHPDLAASADPSRDFVSTVTARGAPPCWDPRTREGSVQGSPGHLLPHGHSLGGCCRHRGDTGGPQTLPPALTVLRGKRTWRAPDKVFPAGAGRGETELPGGHHETQS